MLSEYERRALEEIEREISADNPEVAATFLDPLAARPTSAVAVFPL